MDGSIIQWHWNFDDGSSSIAQQASHTYNSIGLYNVMHYITNSYGCESDTMIKPFHVYPYPIASAGPDLQILEGSSKPLEATASGTDLNYIWTSATYLNSTNVLNPICTPTDDITYTLTVTGIGGCPTLDQVHIIVLKKPVIPNTFSPNNDHVNDKWEIQYLKDYPKAKVQIFTRTGQLVFESAGYLKPWDGTQNGKPLPVDTYYYIIEPESGRAPVTGYVTIIK
jgi:gliding motility-associated-like protein